MNPQKLSFLFVTTFLCAFLSASAILLPTQTQSVAQFISVSGQRAQVSGGGTVNYPASIKDPANFHPGYYILVGPKDTTDAFNRIKSNPDFVGVAKMYNWRDIETATSTYNFSQIDSDLAYLASINKHLWIFLGLSNFASAGPPLTPSYMWKNSQYGGNLPYYGAFQYTSTSAWRPLMWNANVQNRLGALFTALGNHLDQQPYFEGIDLGETSIERGPGWTSAGEENAFKVMALAAKNAFSHKVVSLEVNFLSTDVSTMRQWLADNGVAIGAPDLVLKPTTYTGLFPDLFAAHDKVPANQAIEWDNYERCKTQPNTICTTPGEHVTATDLLNAVVPNANPWYLFWEKRDAYFNSDVVPSVHAYGPLPAAAQFYASQSGSTGGGTPTGPVSCTTFSSSSPIPTGYAASYNLFSTAKETLLSATCNTNNTLSVTVGNNLSTTYIWNQGYLTKDGKTWTPTTFSGTNTSGNWIIGTAKATVPLTSTQLATQNYLAAYVCTYQSSTWKCGCSDTTCAVPKWNLQGVKK